MHIGLVSWRVAFERLASGWVFEETPSTLQTCNVREGRSARALATEQKRDVHPAW